MSPPKICIVGDNCVDLYPVQTKKFVGGNGVNTAVAVQRNGIHCGYLGIVGNDEDGKLIIETLQKEKIDCQRLRQSALDVDVIDTLGVGDAFIGSFLSRFLKNASIPSALKHAAEYSAHSCTIEGAF